MKFVKRNLLWLVMVPMFGALAALVVAQQSTPMSPSGNRAAPTSAGKKPPPPPSNEEGQDSARLIGALDAGDWPTALQILRAHGVAASTIQNMTAELGKSPTRASLSEPFVKAAASVSLSGDADDLQARLRTGRSFGYERLFWNARVREADWQARGEGESHRFSTPPIAVLNVGLDDPEFIRVFQWYDRYADRLHSVVLNGEALTNARLDDDYKLATRTLKALYRLIKARKPDAFVWLVVVKQDSHSDERWLRAMDFKPDGLQISNLKQFHSPFAETRARYVGIVGSDMPMMVAGFYGQKTAVEEKKTALSQAKRIQNAQARDTATNAAAAQLGGVGVVMTKDLSELETNLQSLGYRGLSVHSALLDALTHQNHAGAVETGNLIDPRAGKLDEYYRAGNFAGMQVLTAEMLTNSAPGDLNWTIAKLYEGIALLSQTPPDVSKANAALDEVLAFDFKGKPGRDHYIIGSATWRIYSALLSNDVAKAQKLTQWVQAADLRKDLKASFLTRHKGLLTK